MRAAVASLEPVAGRLAFLHAPFALEHVAAAGTAFGANVLILDYIQRFTVGDGTKDKREQLETAATVLRRFCDAGRGRAGRVGRGAAEGHGRIDLPRAEPGVLPGFVGTGIRHATPPTCSCRATAAAITLQCEKNRYGAVADIADAFDPTTQTFTPAPSGLDGFDAATPARTRGSKAKGG